MNLLMKNRVRGAKTRSCKCCDFAYAPGNTKAARRHTKRAERAKVRAEIQSEAA